MLLEEYKRLDEEWQLGADGEPSGAFKQMLFNTQFLEYMLEKYGELHCEYCGEPNLKIVPHNQQHRSKIPTMATADHFLPKDGNKYIMFNRQNLVVSCHRCNVKLKKNELWPVISLKYYYPEQKIWKYEHQSLYLHKGKGMKKTVRQHLMDIEDPEVRQKCLDNIDERYENEEVYAPGYAVMLGVWQEAKDKAYWEKVYRMLNKGSDNSMYYSSQPVQHEEHPSSGKHH